MKFEEMKGLTLVSAEMNDGKDIVRFVTDKGRVFEQYHNQDCCESVSVEDITGSLSDLIGSPLLVAEERISEGGSDYESSTWTFYEMATIKGSVTIRWLGTSNGYYSEAVYLREV